jgi:hypothetical protein
MRKKGEEDDLHEKNGDSKRRPSHGATTERRVDLESEDNTGFDERKKNRC